VSSKRRSLSRDSFLEASIAAENINKVVDNWRLACLVELGGKVSLSERHSNGV
jgi:hypothetical protein